MAAEEIIGIKVTTDTTQSTKAVEGLDTALTSTSDSVKSLRAQLKEATAAVAIMSEKFGAGSKEAINAAKSAAELKDRIGDAKLLTDAFNPDAKFKAVASSLAGVAGGFSALQGAMALFGVENKDVEKTLLKVNAAMALTQGLNAIGDSIDAFKTLGVQIKASTTFQTLNNAATSTGAAIQKMFGVAVETTSTSFKVLKGAIIATGIGALVVILGEVIANFDAIKKWIMDSPLGSLAKGIGNLVEGFTDFIGVTSEAKRNLDAISKANERANEDINNRIKVLKAQGGSEKEIYDLKIQQTNNELNALRNKAKVNGDLTAEEWKQFRTLKNDQIVAGAEYNKKVNDDTAKANKEAQDAKKKHDDEIKKKNDEAIKQREDDTKAADKMLIDLQNERILAEITNEDDKAKKKLEIDRDAKLKEIDALKISDEEKNKLKTANEEKYQADVKAVDDKIKEEKAKNDKEFEKTLQETLNDTRLATLKDGKEKDLEQLKIDLEAATTEITDNAKYTEEQKGKLIAAERDKYLAKVADIEDEYTKKADEREGDRLKSLIDNETLSFKARKEAADDAIALNKDMYDKGEITLDEYTKTDKELSESRKELAKKEAEVRSENLNKISGTLKNVSKALGEHTVAGKATAIAAATIDTYQSAVSAFKSLAGIPVVGPVLGAVAAAAAIVAGIKNVKAIMAVKAPDVPAGAGPGAGFIDIPSPGTPAMPPSGGGGSTPSLPDMGGLPDMTGGGGDSGGSSGGGGGNATKVYVLESDISNTQKRVAVIQNGATFN